MKKKQEEMEEAERAKRNKVVVTFDLVGRKVYFFAIIDFEVTGWICCSLNYLMSMIGNKRIIYDSFMIFSQYLQVYVKLSCFFVLMVSHVIVFT